MAILTVGSGGDYSTIAAAIAAAGAADTVRLIQDISENVSLNKNIAGIEGDSATARRTWTNSGSTDLLTIDSGLNQAFLFKDLILDSTSTSSGLVYHATSGVSAQTTYRNVQWKHTGANGGNYYWNQNGNTAGMLTFDRCEFVGNATAYGGLGSGVATVAGAVLIQNCIFRGFTRSDSGGAVRLSQASSNNVVAIYCCTFYNCDIGAALWCAGTHTDCAYVGNTDDVDLNNGATTSQFTYCGFGEQATGGTGCVFGLTAGNEFVNAGAADFHLQSGADCRDAGATVASVTEDFDGVSRPQGSAYCIGAFEYVSSAGPTPGSLALVGVGY